MSRAEHTFRVGDKVCKIYPKPKRASTPQRYASIGEVVEILADGRLKVRFPTVAQNGAWGGGFTYRNRAASTLELFQAADKSS